MVLYRDNLQQLIDGEGADPTRLTSLTVNVAMASSDVIHSARSEDPEHAIKSIKDNAATSQVTDDPLNLPDPNGSTLEGRPIRIRLPGNPAAVVRQPVPVSNTVNPLPPKDSISVGPIMTSDQIIEALAEAFQNITPHEQRESNSFLEPPHRSSGDLYRIMQQTSHQLPSLCALPDHVFPVPVTYAVTNIHSKTTLHRPSSWPSREVPSEGLMQLRAKVDYAFDDIPDYQFLLQPLLSSQPPQQHFQGPSETDMLTLQQILAQLENMWENSSESQSLDLAHFLKNATGGTDGAGEQVVEGIGKYGQVVGTTQARTFAVPPSDIDDEEYFTGSEGDESETKTGDEPLRASNRSDTEHIPGGYPVTHENSI